MKKILVIDNDLDYLTFLVTVLEKTLIFMYHQVLRKPYRWFSSIMVNSEFRGHR